MEIYLFVFVAVTVVSFHVSVVSVLDIACDGTLRTQTKMYFQCNHRYFTKGEQR